MTDEWVKYFEDKERNIFNRCISCRRLFDIIINYTPNKGRILEVGCGTGILSLILADYGFDVTASDANQKVLSYAREKMNIMLPNLQFKEADIFKLSSVFKNSYFDTVFSKGVMEHFSDSDIVSGLSEQKRVSRKVIFYVPNKRARKSFGDERLLSDRYWIKLIKKAGFKNIKLFGDYDINRYVYFFPIIFYKKRFSFVWKYFSNHSIFVCE